MVRDLVLSMSLHSSITHNNPILEMTQLSFNKLIV